MRLRRSGEAVPSRSTPGGGVRGSRIVDVEKLRASPTRPKLSDAFVSPPDNEPPGSEKHGPEYFERQAEEAFEARVRACQLQIDLERARGIGVRSPPEMGPLHWFE
jgi:hypothetical protein